MVLEGVVLEIWPLQGGPSFRDDIYKYILNKKKIHDVGCTPLFELGWNDPYVKNMKLVFNYARKTQSRFADIRKTSSVKTSNTLVELERCIFFFIWVRLSTPLKETHLQKLQVLFTVF